MNKIIISGLLGLCLAGFSYLGADEQGLSPTLEEQVLSMDGSNHVSMASFLSQSVSQAKSQVVETHVVTKETLPDGTEFHVGWYQNGYVATVLNGVDTGLQMIVINNELLAYSRNMQVFTDHFRHKYSGGEVISYANRQTLKF